jgi:putative ABC transport system permease protein
MGPPKSSRRRWSGSIAMGAALIAIGLVGWASLNRESAATGAFFGGGSLLLIAGLAAASIFLRKLWQAGGALSLTGMGIRNCARRRKRSLATIALLACATFLIVAVGANKLDSSRDSTRPSSGTGGFAFIGESTLPVVHDLNEKAGREFFSLDETKLQNVALISMRVRDGDDASCLNLNRAQTPRLIGVKPEQLQARHAFTLKKVAKGFSPEKGWMLLQRPSGDDAIPAIGDEASIVWALGKKIGDVIPYTDERGRTFKLRLVAGVANSILQGNLLISEQEFLARFPSETGYRMFLIDAPSKNASEVSSMLARSLQDVGFELTPAAQRLAAFNAVQNTYLNTFQALGGLGLLLGSIGLGVVVLRNVLERRGEFAVLRAVGFQSRSLRWLVLSEHAALLCCGLGLGIATALVAVLPSMLSPGSEISYRSLGLTLGAVFGSGLVWTWAGTLLALRGELLNGLRNN